MKKFIIYSILASLSLIVFMCNFTKFKYYNPITKKYNSLNIKESKEYGVFLAEYIPENYIYIFLKDTLVIQEIWIENCWNSTYFHNEVETIQDYNVCSSLLIKFNINTSQIKSWTNKYKVKNNYGPRSGGIMNGNLVSMSYQNQNHLLDTLIFPIYQRNDSLDKEEIIGELRFFKKK